MTIGIVLWVAVEVIVLALVYRALKGLVGLIADTILRNRGFDPWNELVPYVDYFPVREAIWWKKPEPDPDKLERKRI